MVGNGRRRKQCVIITFRQIWADKSKEFSQGGSTHYHQNMKPHIELVDVYIPQEGLMFLSDRILKWNPCKVIVKKW